jgi:hypothetical protein
LKRKKTKKDAKHKYRMNLDSNDKRGVIILSAAAINDNREEKKVCS